MTDPGPIGDALARCALATATPPHWAEAAAARLPELLVEQAHLEKKAAAAAVRFLFRLPGSAQAALSQLAREELVHFERALRLLRDRGIAFGPQQPSPYAEALKALCARAMPERLVDELLVAALIEARSHERMAALAGSLRRRDAEAAAFYRELVAAEARHRVTYLELAATLVGPAVVAARWARLAHAEAAHLQQPMVAPRLHGAHGRAAGVEGTEDHADG